MAIDYSKTIIYKISCKDVNVTDIYVGHSTNMELRIADHKAKTNNETNPKHNCKVYEFIRNNGGISSWEFVEVEKYPCQNKNQAEERERYWYDTLGATLNTNRPKISKKEAAISRRESAKKWRENNLQKAKEYAIQYRELNADKIKENYVEYGKKYRENNKEKIQQKNESYYIKNKEKIKQQKKAYYERTKKNKAL